VLVSAFKVGGNKGKCVATITTADVFTPEKVAKVITLTANKSDASFSIA
jgi:hypothetical protein